MEQNSLEKIPSQGFRHMACISRDKKYLYYIDSGLNLARRDLQLNNTIVFYLHDQLKKLNFFFSNPRDLADDVALDEQPLDGGLAEAGEVLQPVRSHVPVGGFAPDP